MSGMTEAEARDRWCPLSFNRDGLLPCGASGCMAWRWSRAKETKAYLEAVQQLMKTSGVDFKLASNKIWAESGSTFERTDGYCGLAGRPE